MTPSSGPAPFRRVLVANRGEIACRVIATLRRRRVDSVAVFSDPDRASAHVRQADAAVALGGETAADSYLRADLIVRAALDTGAEAVHPGYGFLSESAAFARAVEAAGLAFVGPTPAQIEEFGDKDRARALARAAGVPLLPGTGVLPHLEAAAAEAAAIGYPVLLKATAGGGGIGMARCDGPGDLADAWARVTRAGTASFGSGALFIERFLPVARHVEVQVVGDGRGAVAVLGDRDCSVQRRNQKVLEEAPAPDLDPQMRAGLHEAARALARSVDYRSVGTVEFLVDPARGEFHFLEVNTRLQVEHGVTELVTGLDLVGLMLDVAGGADVPPDAEPSGHAVEARLYAEDPARGFQPSAGLLTAVRFPPGVRVDTWIDTGTEVTPLYDPLLAKVLVPGDDRAAAIAGLGRALAATEVAGVETNREWVRAVLDDPRFGGVAHGTRTFEDLPFRPPTIEVLAPAGHVTVQDWPGRLGYWAVGVPPSGPMDDRSFRLGNRAVGNPDGRRGARVRGARADAAVRPAGGGLPDRGRHGSDAGRRGGRALGPGRRRPRPDPGLRPGDEPGGTWLRAAGRRDRRARAPGQPGHVHARWVRRTRRPGAAAGRRAAPRRRRGRRAGAGAASRRRSGRRSTGTGTSTCSRVPTPIPSS